MERIYNKCSDLLEISTMLKQCLEMKIEIFRILRVKPMATSIKHLGNRENLLKVLRKGRLSGRREKQRVYGDGAI